MFSTPRARNRRIAVVVVALLGTGLLAGCSGQPTGSTTLDTKAAVTLTVWTGQEAGAEKLLEKLGAKFQKLHPNVTLKLSPGASSTEDLLQKLSASFAGGNYPDMSYSFGSWTSQLESSGRTLDITDKVADPSVKWSEFSKAAQETARPTGKKTIGFPAIVDNLSLLYNKTVFDKAGVAYPTNDWTWDDFRAAAKKLTDPSTNTYGYAYGVSGSEETTWQLWPHLWQNGGSILSADATKSAFDSEAGRKSVTFLRDLAITDKSVYLDQTDTKAAQLFASDSIGMITSGPWELYDLGIAKTKYGVTFLPGTDGNHATVSGPDVWALFDKQDANRAYWAYEWAKYLTDPAQDLEWNVAIGNLPLRSSEVASPEFAAQVKANPGLDVMAANSANATTARPTVAGYVGLSAAVGDAVSQVLQGKGTAASALTEAATKADKALKDK